MRNVRAIARVSKESRKCSGLSSFLGPATLLASSSSSCFVLLQYCPAFGSCSCVPAVGGNQLRRLVGSAVRSSTVCKLGSWVLAYRLGVGGGGGGRENLTTGSQCFVLYLKSKPPQSRRTGAHLAEADRWGPGHWVSTWRHESVRWRMHATGAVCAAGATQAGRENATHACMHALGHPWLVV